MQAHRGYGRQADRALGTWVKLARAFNTFNRLTAEDIRRYGLTQPQFGVLEVLGHKGAMTLGDLSHKTLSSGGNTTVVVHNMERDGLVERTVSEWDRRVHYVALTKKGKRMFRRIFPQHARAVAKIAGVLTPEEQELLGGLLRKLGWGAERGEGRGATRANSLNSK